MAVRSRWAGVVVGALCVGYVGAVVLGSYVTGGAVIDAMRTQQAADVVAVLPYQEMAMVTISQERSLATVVDRACAPSSQGCAAADQARTALLTGVPELGQDGTPVVGDDGNLSFTQPSAVQQTITALDQRDEAFGGLDVGMLDPQVHDAIALMLSDRDVVDTIHDSVEGAPGQAIEAHDQYLQSGSGVSESLAEVTDRELRDEIEAQRLLNELLLAIFQERALVVLAVGASEAGQPGYLEPAAAQVTATDTLVVETQEALVRAASDQQILPIDGDLALVRSAVASGELGTLPPARIQGFSAASATWLEEMLPAQDAVRRETIDHAQDQATVATNRALFTGAVTVGALVVGLIAVIVVSVLLLRRRRTPPAPPVGWPQPHEVQPQTYYSDSAGRPQPYSP